MKKIKVYLDTSIIFGYFLAKALEIKGKRKFELPEIIKFLMKNKEQLEFYISEITENELIRRLVTELNLEINVIEKELEKFKKELNLNLIKSDEVNFADITKFIREVVSKIKIKKRVTNLEHLAIAKQFGLIFATGDKEILIKCKQFYPKTISYIELRKTLNTRNLNVNYENERKVGRTSFERIYRVNSQKTRKNEEEGPKNLQRAYGICLLVFISFLILLSPLTLAQGRQTHPLSQITPIDVTLNMSNNTAGISQNITGVGYLGIGIVGLPSYRLDVSGSAWIRPELFIGGNLRRLYDTGSMLGIESSVYLSGDIQIGGNDIMDSGGVIRLTLGNPLLIPSGTNLNLAGGDLLISGLAVITSARNIINVGWVNATNVNVSNQLCLGGICKTSWPTSLVGGSGSPNNITKWLDSSTLTSSIIYETGGRIGIGTTSPSYSLHVAGDVGWTGTLQTGTVPWTRLSGYDLNVAWTGTLGGGNITAGTIGSTQLASDSASLSKVTGGAMQISGNAVQLASGKYLEVGGGYGGGGLTIDQYGNILTKGNLTYSGYTYVISTLEFNGTANYPFGINVGGRYSGGAGANGQIDIRPSDSTSPKARISTDGTDLIINTAQYGANLRVNGTVLPYLNNQFSLGSSSYQWANIYGQNVYSGGNAVLTTATTFSGNVTGTYNSLNLAPNSVDSAKIVDNSITSSDVAFNFVGSISAGPGITVSGGTGKGVTNTISLNYNTDLLGWGNLTNYPSDCPEGQYVYGLNDTHLKCSAPSLSSAGGWTDTDSYVRLTTSTDKVIIGADYAPQQKLDVVGNVNVTGSIYEGGTALSSKYVPQTRQVLAGAGLTGGGSLGSDVTLSVAFGEDFLGWRNLTNYPAGCGAGQAVQAIGDTLTCVAITPGEAGVIGSGTVGYIPMWNGTNSINNSIIYQSGGNIGIGTTSPLTKLDVVGNVNASVYYDRENSARYLDPSGTSVIGAMSMYGGLSMNNYDISGVNALSINDPGPGEGISWSGTAAGWVIDVSPLDRSNTDGNLNIYGTANNIIAWRPTYIYTSATPQLVINSTGTTAQFILQTSNTVRGNITADSFGNVYITPGNYLVVPSGNVGIGMISPSYKLDVSGTGRISNAGTSFILDSNGDVWVKL